MKVRLTRKFAERIDGVDLRGYEVGDVLDLPPRETHLLLAEEWAVPDPRGSARRAARHASEDLDDLQRAG